MIVPMSETMKGKLRIPAEELLAFRDNASMRVSDLWRILVSYHATFTDVK